MSILGLVPFGTFAPGFHVTIRFLTSFEVAEKVLPTILRLPFLWTKRYRPKQFVITDLCSPCAIGLDHVA
jgi:hypothetical protein